MNNQQTRIWRLLEEAASDHENHGRVSIFTKTELASEGYDLRALPNDIHNLTGKAL